MMTTATMSTDMTAESKQPVLAYIALGSNLGDPLAQVSSGLDELAALPHCHLRRQSYWYRSKAIGPGAQPDYINGVVQLETTLSATALFEQIQRIESSHGRERRVRWAARTLDLDILLYGDRIIRTEQLQVPHPRLTERNFVLYPLRDIDPDLVLPDGTDLKSLLTACTHEGLERL